MKLLAESKPIQHRSAPGCAARIAAADFLRSDGASIDLQVNLARLRLRRARRREAECVLPRAWCLNAARRYRRICRADHARRLCAPTRAENPGAPGHTLSDDRS